MKTLIQHIRPLMISLLLGAGTSALPQDAPGLEVSDLRWESSNAIHPSRYNTPTDRGQAANVLPSSEASALFRNTGRKVIKSVTWKYVFYKDPQHIEVAARCTFRTRKRIDPGGEVRLKESVFSTSEPRTWTDYHAVAISRIVYADGSVWNTEAGKK